MLRKIVALSGEQNHKCCYCRHVMGIPRDSGMLLPENQRATRDHYIPKTHGGSYYNNLVAACLQCNNVRGDMEAMAFYVWLQRLFKRKPTLRKNWHQLDKARLREVTRLRLETQVRQLEGLGKRDPEYAFRHQKLVTKYGYKLGNQE